MSNCCWTRYLFITGCGGKANEYRTDGFIIGNNTTPQIRQTE